MGQDGVVLGIFILWITSIGRTGIISKEQILGLYGNM